MKKCISCQYNIIAHQLFKSETNNEPIGESENEIQPIGMIVSPTSK